MDLSSFCHHSTPVHPSPITDLAYFPWEVTTSLPLGPCSALDGTEFAPPSFPASEHRAWSLGQIPVNPAPNPGASSTAVQSIQSESRMRKGNVNVEGQRSDAAETILQAPQLRMIAPMERAELRVARDQAPKDRGAPPVPDTWA